MGGTWEGAIPLKALSPSAGASDIGEGGQVSMQVCKYAYIEYTPVHTPSLPPTYYHGVGCDVVRSVPTRQNEEPSSYLLVHLVMQWLGFQSYSGCSE